jgi:hypothetical protein
LLPLAQAAGERNQQQAKRIQRQAHCVMVTPVSPQIPSKRVP